MDSADEALVQGPLWGPMLVISNIILDSSGSDVGTSPLAPSSGTLFLQPRETRV